jgi:hypothetical protein
MPIGSKKRPKDVVWAEKGKKVCRCSGWLLRLRWDREGGGGAGGVSRAL